MPLRLLLALVLAAFTVAASAQADDQRLPQLGSSANALLTPEEAYQIGAGMLYQMRALDLVVKDPELNQYVNDVGYRLVAHAHIAKGMKFTFFVVRSDQINAFAAPGGFIGVNAGLITATQNESELAAVLAHEIAHVTQHHLERAEEDARKMAPLVALAMLGAVAASGGSGSGDAVPAAIASGMGLIAQRQINFTRKDEAEADRVGIHTLAAAGFDVDGMADFFGRMERLLRPGSGGIDVPEFLRSHPVTSTRISEAKSLAHIIKTNAAKHPKTEVGKGINWSDSTAPLLMVRSPATIDPGRGGDRSRYLLMRERARVLSAPHNNQVLDYYRANLGRTAGFDNESNRYGYALALVQANRGADALKQLKPLVAKHPTSLPLQLAVADAELHAGHASAAMKRYAGLIQTRPRDAAIAGAYANALLTTKRAADARRAADLLKPLLDDDEDDPGLYRTYGRACEHSGQDVRAAEAFADASYLSGHATDALNQLKRLLKRKDLNYYQRARIEARIEYITPIALELARRGISADKQGF